MARNDACGLNFNFRNITQTLLDPIWSFVPPQRSKTGAESSNAGYQASKFTTITANIGKKLSENFF